MPITNPFGAGGNPWNPQNPVQAGLAPPTDRNQYGRDMLAGHPGGGDLFGYYSGQAGATGRELAGLNLYDPAVLAQLSQTLQPYFQGQQSNLLNQYSNMRGASLSDAGQSAGAIAAFKGYDPSSYVSNARQRAENALSPQFFSSENQLGTDQMATLLNALNQSQQFKAGNLGQAAGIFGGEGQNWLNDSQFNQQLALEQANQPGFGDYLGAGLLGLGGSFLGPVGGAVGASLGSQWFGKP